MNGNVIPLSLQTIANWQISPESNGGNIHAEIPAFQRGFVWNPAQIEVLWDSLLRGIPIGVISLIPMEGAERYSQKATGDERKGYFILDGQQRCNAITLGFCEFNGDDKNPIYRAKPTYQSIVEFHAAIFNRWGQKLFEWTDPSKGWDGTFNGKDVKDGVYYVHVQAKGADGVKYNIKKDVNLLRGFTDTTSGNR